MLFSATANYTMHNQTPNAPINQPQKPASSTIQNPEVVLEQHFTTTNKQKTTTQNTPPNPTPHQQNPYIKRRRLRQVQQPKVAKQKTTCNPNPNQIGVKGE
jgi:hypothetical protein